MKLGLNVSTAKSTTLSYLLKPEFGIYIMMK